MKKFNRSSLRNAWLASIVVLVVSSLLCFKYAKDTRLSIDEARLDLDAAYRELDNAKRLSASLTELDHQTINEKTATRLEILRHLGLERMDYTVNINGRQQQQVGPTNLYLRDIEIVAQLPYGVAMELADRLHNTGRIVLNRLTMEAGGVPEHVKLTLNGTLYGLDKRKTTDESATAAADATAGVSNSTPLPVSATTVPQPVSASGVSQ